MFNNFRKNITTNEKYILRKMGLNFHKIALYMYFVIKFERFWSREAMGNK